MLSTADFFALSKQNGFTRVLAWAPSGGGVAQFADVIFRAPARDVLGGEAVATDYSAEYPAGQLAGMKRGEVVTISSVVGAVMIDGQQYAVREGPRNKESPADGSVLEIKLRKGT